MSLSEHLKAARNARNMSRNDLALRVNRSIHTVKSWELGKHVPARSMQRKLETIFNKPMGYFSQNDNDRLSATIHDLREKIQRLPDSKREYAIKTIEYLSKTIH